jgi:hypothetical protein
VRSVVGYGLGALLSKLCAAVVVGCDLRVIEVLS